MDSSPPFRPDQLCLRPRVKTLALDLRGDLIAIYQAALDACDAGRLVEERLRRDPPPGPVWLLALGKPSAIMARAARSVLGQQLQGGLVVLPEGVEPPGDPSVAFLIGGHPYPDARSALAGDALLAAAASIPEGTSVVVLLAGGGSALAVAPVNGLDLKDKIAAHRELLRAGLPIQIVNGVRSHLSRIKGGGLLRALARSPALTGGVTRESERVRVEILSDVADGELDSVASGPCSPDRSTFSGCLDAVRDASYFPSAAMNCLREGQQGLRPETLKPDDPLVQAVAYHRLAGPRDLLSAAVAAARARGLDVEAEELPWQLGVGPAVARMSRWLAGSSTPRLLVAVGEVHLTLPAHPGIGGRAQQLALAMAPVLAEHRATLLVAGTDGRDGTSPFAGAVVGSDLEHRAQRSGRDIKAALARCDASSVISALGLGLPATPPTSNLTDLVLLAREE
jgi:glycerate 2-kinase